MEREREKEEKEGVSISHLACFRPIGVKHIQKVLQPTTHTYSMHVVLGL